MTDIVETDNKIIEKFNEEQINFLNITHNNFNEFAEQLKYKNDYINKIYNFITYKINFIKSLICALKYNKSKNKNIRFSIPIKYNETIISNVLNDMIESKKFSLKFVNFDEKTLSHCSFDIDWNDNDELYNYLISFDTQSIFLCCTTIKM